MWLYGVKSRIPKRFEHWVLLDIDDPNISSFAKALFYCYTRRVYGSRDPIIFYRTLHGFHAILFSRHSFKFLSAFLPTVPFIDKTWCALGSRRGYWFLLTPQKVKAPLGCQISYMKIRPKVESPWLDMKLQKSLMSYGREKMSLRKNTIVHSI